MYRQMKARDLNVRRAWLSIFRQDIVQLADHLFLCMSLQSLLKVRRILIVFLII